MGNIAHVSSYRNLSVEGITADLNEINKRRFNSLFDIKVVGESWSVSYMDAENERFCWQLYLSDTKRKVDGKHPMCGMFMQWVWGEFLNELAMKWNGRIGDEGVDGTWKATEAKTYSDFYEKYNMLEGAGFLLKSLYRITKYAIVPKKFKSLARKA